MLPQDFSLVAYGQNSIAVAEISSRIDADGPAYCVAEERADIWESAWIDLGGEG